MPNITSRWSLVSNVKSQIFICNNYNLSISNSLHLSYNTAVPLHLNMKLSLVLFRRNRLPNGHLFRGKDRLVQKVEPKHLRKMQHEFAIEEQNMLYLRYPYLSEAESSGHTKALGKPEMKKQKILDKTRRIFKQDVTLYERLQHLRVKESWD